MFWTLMFLFFIPLLLLLFYFALSSCLGRSLREPSATRPSYGRAYLSSIPSGSWENIEMDNINRARDPGYDDDGEQEFR
ncbi:hypothetical protein RUND412_007680 [Rhizina undulata]